jgi:hypothetical protein
VIDLDDNGLVFVFPASGARIAYGRHDPVFRLFVDQATARGTQREITQADCTAPVIARDGGSLSLAYRFRPSEGSGTLEVRIGWETGGREVLGRIEIDNGTGLRIERVQFPLLPFPQVENNDRLLFSSSWGDEFPWPVKTIRQYCAMGGLEAIYPGLRLEAIRHGKDEVAYAYPSILAMQYLTLHSKGRSVYLSCYGTDGNSLSLNAQAVGNGLLFSVNHKPYLGHGTWRSPECGVAIVPGDWHSAADLYASRMRGVFKPPRLPAWMQEGFHGWVQVMMHFENERPLHCFRDLPALFRDVKEKSGIEVLHVCGWNGRGHDTLYPDYDPDPALGTADDLRSAINAIHAQGGRVILYTNGRLVDPDSAFARQSGGRCVCVDANGQPYVERYFNSVRFQIACPACVEYGEYLAGQIGTLCRELGADAVQIDQISCNQGLPCHDSRHPHTTPANNFLEPTDRMLQTIRRTHLGIDPDSFTWIEGCHERFGQYYDVSQGHGEGGPGWEILGPVPEQFKYTYPDYLVTGSCNTIQQLCHTFAQGKPFDLGVGCLEDPDYAALLRRLLEVRRSYSRYFLHGIFRDNVGLQVAGDARAYRIDHPGDAGMIVTAWLPGASLRQKASTSLKNPMPGSVCRRVYPESLDVYSGAGWIELTWEGPLAAVLFESVP